MRAALIVAGLLAAGCSFPESVSPTAVTVPITADGSARVTTMSVLDQPLVNSCDTSSFRIHQKNGEHGQLATVFEERPGPFNTAWDVEYQRRNNVKGKPNDYEGALTLRARGYTSIVEVQINNGGVYRGRMRGNRCSNWSAWIEFTIGPNPEQEVEPEPVCEGIVTPNGCLVREDE